jgi:hypothetical protein
MISLVLMLACQRTEPPPAAPSLTEPLGPDAVRAGVVTDPAALIGGISAEGQPGDVLIYNDRARFIIQGVHPSSYYVPEGGGVVDADIVRPAGAPDHDIADEWMPAYGLTTLLEPTRVTVVSDGADGAAVVRVEGVEAPLALLEGALEAPGFLRMQGLTITHEYVLRPGTPLLEVRSIVSAETALSLSVSDIIFGAPEAAAAWRDRTGVADADGGDQRWVGYVDRNADVAIALLPPLGTQWGGGGIAALSGITDLVAGTAEAVTLEPGVPVTVTRYYGVGPDLRALTDAWQALDAGSDTIVEGTVTDDMGPVAGATVTVLVDGAPFTAGRTGADGAFRATVPAGASTSLHASGQGDGLFMDLPAGAGPLGPYAPEPARSNTLRALASGSTAAAPVARGQGWSGDLRLTRAGVVRLSTADGLPFAGWLDALDPQPPRDERLDPGGPSGHTAAAFARDGAVDLLVPPGRYRAVMHRGLRFEAHAEEITVTAGGTTEVQAALPAAYTHPGWLWGDPHAHAAPSGDASISMEDRLIVHAATGYQVHFGTDHDHLADYRPLLAPLGLDGVMRSIVADEVSPPLRGHFNIYPVEPKPEANGGAFAWWTDFPESTDALFATLRARHGDRFVLQSNHPTSSGLASSAGWEPGTVDDPGRWSTAFQAVEVLNASDWQEFLPFFLDITSRGQLVAPVGVTDSHHHFGGGPGYNGTFIKVGVDTPAELTDDLLVDAMRNRRTIVSRGPLLTLSVDPGSTVQGSLSVDVTARSPSWIRVDRLRLLENGVEVEVVTGTSATFRRTPAADAHYVILAEGDAPMSPVSGNTPWAMAAPILVDVDGDGWEAPLGPIAEAD